MRIYRFRIYPSKVQETHLNQHLWLAKNLWNNLLEHSRNIYNDFEKFPTRDSLQTISKNSGLFARTACLMSRRVLLSIWRYVKLKKSGRKSGFPRFKSFDRMRSLCYPQSGFWLEKKLKVTPFGKISIVRHREIKGKIKNLTLKKLASGKWFACFDVEEIKNNKPKNHGSRIGVDLGLKTLATLSDGSKIKNPRFIRMHEKKLGFFNKKFSKKMKGSSNRTRAKTLLAIRYEKLKNSRIDFLHKLSHNLVNSHSFIALENLASQELSQQNFGKQINDAGWGRLANMLRYKAESAGCEVVFVDPKDTTKACCRCNSKRNMPLSERIYFCDNCGNHMNRDLNAAINILTRATEGHSESNACGDESVDSSMKLEAHTFGYEHATQNGASQQNRG